MRLFSQRQTLSDEGAKKNEAMCKAFNRLSSTLVLLVPPTEFALVSTKLQEAFFWAQYGMRSLSENRKPK